MGGCSAIDARRRRGMPLTLDSSGVSKSAAHDATRLRGDRASWSAVSDRQGRRARRCRDVINSRRRREGTPSGRAHYVALRRWCVAPLGLFEGVDRVLVVDEVALLRGGLAARHRALVSMWRPTVPRRYDVTLLAHADARYRAMLRPVRLGRVRTPERPPHGSLPIPGR